MENLIKKISEIIKNWNEDWKEDTEFDNEEDYIIDCIKFIIYDDNELSEREMELFYDEYEIFKIRHKYDLCGGTITFWYYLAEEIINQIHKK